MKNERRKFLFKSQDVQFYKERQDVQRMKVTNMKKRCSAKKEDVQFYKKIRKNEMK